MNDHSDMSVPENAFKPSNAIGDRVRSVFAQHNYELLGELGRGGMGVVYLAQHKKLGRRVAIKTLTPDRQTKENSIRRFEREAKTFAQIRHPHIANLFEFQDDGPIAFLALEYIEGTDLERERRKNREWKPEEVAKMVANVADALQHTHEKGILHRDIKPGNILIERNTNRVVLTDFGLAKGQQDDTLTATGFAVGTPAYMAPEQITDQFGVKPDGRSDLFSLGTVAYEMLTGKHPFLAPDDLNTMRNIVNGSLKPIREIAPAIPADLARIIEDMMVKNPRDRTADAGIVARQLNEWLASQSGRRTPSEAPKAILPTPRPAPPPKPAEDNDISSIPPAQVVPPAAPGISTKQLFIIIAICSVVALAIGFGVAVMVL